MLLVGAYIALLHRRYVHIGRSSSLGGSGVDRLGSASEREHVLRVSSVVGILNRLFVLLFIIVKVVNFTVVKACDLIELALLSVSDGCLDLHGNSMHGVDLLLIQLFALFRGRVEGVRRVVIQVLVSLGDGCYLTQASLRIHVDTVLFVHMVGGVVQVFIFLVNLDHNCFLLHVVLGCLEMVLGISEGANGVVC
jgi:hypothetical protein